MSEVISLDGLRKLLKMKEEGKPLPENYEELVRNYIKFKFASVERHERNLERIKEQLKEAIGIASALNVSIKIEREI